MANPPPFSTNGSYSHSTPANPPAAGERKNPKFLIIALIVIPLLVLFVIPLAFTIASLTSKTAFERIDDLKLDEISRFEIRLYNLKDSLKSDRKDDDVGPFVAKPESYAALIEPLKNATAVDTLPVKAFLGEYRIQLNDGSRQVVRLSFTVPPEPNGPRMLAFKIGTRTFRAGDVKSFVAIVEASDPRPKP